MNEKKQFVKNSEQSTTLYVYGEIRKKDLWDMLFDDDETRAGAYDFAKALNEIETPNLTVRINSMGGDVSEGLAIYNLLSNFEGEVTTIIDGFACSAASVIFMAGDKRIAPESSLLMIHNAWSKAVGDSNAMKKAAEDLEKITQPSVNIYVSKTGQSETSVKNMMDKETWLTSQEAFDLGFATSIEKNEAQQSLSDVYLHKLILREKELEERIEALSQKDSKIEPNSWSGYFKGEK